MTPTCRGKKTSGDPCTVTLGLSNDELCAHHDPERSEQMRVSSSAGGRASGESRKPAVVLPDPSTIPPPMKGPEDCAAWASWLAVATLRGDVDSKTAHEISIMIGAFQRGHDYAHGQKRVTELKKQLDELQKDKKRAGR